MDKILQHPHTRSAPCLSAPHVHRLRHRCACTHLWLRLESLLSSCDPVRRLRWPSDTMAMMSSNVWQSNTNSPCTKKPCCLFHRTGRVFADGCRRSYTCTRPGDRVRGHGGLGVLRSACTNLLVVYFGKAATNRESCAMGSGALLHGLKHVLHSSRYQPVCGRIPMLRPLVPRCARPHHHAE